MTDEATLQALSDEELMLEYQNGRLEAFELLLGRYHRQIYNVVYRMMGHPQLAEDLVQDVFIRVIRGAKSYTRQAKFKTWLFTITRNLCIDTMRKKKYRKTRSLDEPIGGDEGRTMMDTVRSHDPGSERRVDDKRFKKKLEAALEKLNPEQREVFVLRQFQGLPFKEIAVISGCSENTIKSRMRYALESLREELKEFYKK